MREVINKRERVIAFAAAAVIIIFAALNFIIEPLLSRASSLNKEIKLAKAKLIEYSGLLTAKSGIKSDHVQASQEGNAAKNVFEELEALAKDSGLKILDMRPQPVKPLEIYKEMNIDLRTQGMPESFIRVIYSIENSPLLLKVRKLQLNALPNSSDLEGYISVSQVILE